VKFYKRFPGDITIKTGDLSLTEFGAYDRLLDHYYAKETPIDPKKVYTVARCQTPADRRAVDAVLLEYWTLTQLGWVQQRADEMIAEAQPKIEAARENGKKGGRPSKAQQAKLDALQEPSGFSLETQDEPNEKTSQSQNQKGSVANATAADAAVEGGEVGVKPKSAEEMTKAELRSAGKSLLAHQGLPEAQCGSFVGALVKQYGDAVVIEAVRATVLATPVDAKEYLKATCMRKKGERRDPVTVSSDAAEKTKAAHRADDALLAAQDPEERARRLAEVKATRARLKGCQPQTQGEPS
jgi:uncharacterized protein YdaU (DUF1376 family)